jgi:type 1 glutamine amidotransferase
MLAAAICLTVGLTNPIVTEDYDVLVFSKTAGFRHASIPDGIAAIRKLGAANGFSVDATEDADRFLAKDLDKYEVIVFLSTTGNFFEPKHEAAFTKYIQGGGGYVGIHAAADAEYDWEWYGNLVGGYFLSHPAQQEATVYITDKKHPSTGHLPTEWVRFDEWYDYKAVPAKGVRILGKLLTTTYTGHKMGLNHPIIWCHEYDGGRAFYTGGGHTKGSFSEPEFLRHILGGIQWAKGKS